MDEQEYIEAIRKDRKESVSFFSSERKPERERWVVNEFLENIGLPIDVDEIISSNDEPPDVYFRGAKFEVKEILDPGRKRHAEYKESLRRAEKAKSADDLLEQYTPRDITYSEICDLVIERLGVEQRYAPAARRQLDILFYVNLEHSRAYVASQLPSPQDIEQFGWRSVSFLAGPMSVVLHACEDAPAFLQDIEGKVLRKDNIGESR